MKLFFRLLGIAIMARLLLLASGVNRFVRRAPVRERKPGGCAFFLLILAAIFFLFSLWR